MTQKTIVHLTDDLDGTDADETVRFGIDGEQYEIDLNTGNAEKLRDLLGVYVDAGRRYRPVTAPVPAGMRRVVGSSAIGKDKARLVRAWAEHSGWEVSRFGRIPNEVVAAYDAANG